MAALGELGLADRLLAEGASPEHVELRTTGGRVLRRLHVADSLGRAQSVIALRQVLHGALFAALDPDDVELQSEAVGYEAGSAGASLVLADSRSIRGDVLVAADGAGSVIRSLLHPREGPARRSGYVGIRGVAYDAERHLGGLSAVGYFARGIETAAARAGGGAIYWYVSLLARDLPPAERDARAIAARCGLVLDATFQRIVDATRPEDVRMDELCDREPLDVWGHGPVTLLGDAAHPMLPHAGQGAAQALEDAVALALALGRDPSPASLRRYEHVRAARTAKIVRLARKIARITTTRSRTIALLRGAGVRLAPASVMLSAYYQGAAEDPHRALRSS
jgi:2-polyprenyl-6-methoxyphenol hydroxylase-like FAD-dependent oxidoreductase